MVEAHALTVDVEDWFHICGVAHLDREHWDRLPARVDPTTRWLLDRLQRRNVRATFFVVGWVAARYPALVADIAAAGHEIGSHSHWHQRVYEMTPGQFADDLRQSTAAISACGVTPVPAFRAPAWSINGRSLWALEVLASQQITLDSSMAPLRVVGDPGFPQEIHRRQTPAGSLTECPPAIERRFGQQVPFGGGWGLRRSRPRRVLRELERRLARRQPAVLWIHPWELDDDPPRTPLPLGLRAAHYLGLSGFRRRYDDILAGSVFAPLSEVAAAALGR